MLQGPFHSCLFVDIKCHYRQINTSLTKYFQNRPVTHKEFSIQYHKNRLCLQSLRQSNVKQKQLKTKKNSKHFPGYSHRPYFKCKTGKKHCKMLCPAYWSLQAHAGQPVLPGYTQSTTSLPLVNQGGPVQSFQPGAFFSAQILFMRFFIYFFLFLFTLTHQ